VLVLNCYRSELAMLTPHERNTNDSEATVTDLARFMFDLQADTYDAHDAMRELAWADENIRGFWVDQAGAVVSFLRLDRCA
jgi:hypothetical protein